MSLRFLKAKIAHQKSINSSGFMQTAYWQLSSHLAYCSLPSRVGELDLGLMVPVNEMILLCVNCSAK